MTVTKHWNIWLQVTCFCNCDVESC
jgi:hypothetical protein